MPENLLLGRLEQTYHARFTRLIKVRYDRCCRGCGENDHHSLSNNDLGQLNGVRNSCWCPSDPFDGYAYALPY